jgi:plastocyanin
MVTKATIHVVQVSNFQFSPANITDVFVGDTVRFNWVSGVHTTTNDPATQGAENVLPPGAAPWNSPMTSTVTTFDYKVTVAGLYKYFCIPHKSGMIGEFTASSTLPIKLSSFIIQGSKDRVSLNWKTASEENVDHFSVRRSAGGSGYTEIAQVKATGNSQVESSYSFTDTKISANHTYYYYYIVSVDRDGREMLSETKQFKNTFAKPRLILTLSPNPVTNTGHIMMRFNAEKRGKMDVKVVNTEGRLISNTTLQAFEGINNGHIGLRLQPAGIYSFIFTMNGVRETYKVVFK